MFQVCLNVFAMGHVPAICNRFPRLFDDTAVFRKYAHI